ncbi:hypothetical protein U3516DRAFT_802354 [Neocallimastix sp. 'constans']
MLKIDNFSEKNNKIGNDNNGKCETNNNIIISKEENKNNFIGSANIKKNQDNNIEINKEININESVKINGINNRTNKSVTSDFIKEVNIIDSNNSKVDNIQITSNANKNEQFINKKYSVNNITYIKEKKINNNNFPIDFSKIINVDSNKDIKIEEIKKKIKIKHICIQNNGKNKININKLMILKQPEIAFKGDY